MADVEMTDAPVPAAKGKGKAAADGKKRFEVKKVPSLDSPMFGGVLTHSSGTQLLCGVGISS